MFINDHTIPNSKIDIAIFVTILLKIILNPIWKARTRQNGQNSRKSPKRGVLISNPKKCANFVGTKIGPKTKILINDHSQQRGDDVQPPHSDVQVDGVEDMQLCNISCISSMYP